MSHFTVLVVGEDFERQLRPYHEFECTGINDEFVEEVDATDDARSDYESYCREDYNSFYDYVCKSEEYGVINLNLDQSLDVEGDHKYRYAVVKDGEVVKVVRRTNPNAKWDWYLLGGRWTGFFKLKTGADGDQGEPGVMTSPAEPGTADSARKGDIDWNAMKQDSEVEAGEAWDKVNAAAPEGWEPWEVVLERFTDSEVPPAELFNEGERTYVHIDDARTYYHSQPGLKAAREALGHSWDLDQYLVPREEHVRKAGRQAVSTYAVLHDGVWEARGEMGWFGISSNEAECEDDWYDRIEEILSNVPDDEILHIVDCHI